MKEFIITENEAGQRHKNAEILRIHKGNKFFPIREKIRENTKQRKIGLAKTKLLAR